MQIKVFSNLTKPFTCGQLSYKLVQIISKYHFNTNLYLCTPGNSFTHSIASAII